MKERRVCDIELRKMDDGTQVITGYAIVFNKESRDLGGFKETISPGALDKTNMSDVVALFNHDANIVLGRTDKTLKLSIDENGLRYDIIPPKNEQAKSLIESISRGDIKGSSFGFTIGEGGDTWDKPTTDKDLWKRTITDIDRLYDVSPVVFPAYEATDTAVAKRSLGMLRDKIEREETERLEQEKAKERARIENYHKKLKLQLLKCKEGV